MTSRYGPKTNICKMQNPCQCQGEGRRRGGECRAMWGASWGELGPALRRELVAVREVSATGGVVAVGEAWRVD